VLDEPGYWKHNRIAWAGASVVPFELESMSPNCEARLRARNIGFDPKGFVSHVTLLRDAREAPAMPAFEPIEWESRRFSHWCSP